MIGNLFCYDCFGSWLLLWVAVFIGIYHSATNYFRDKQAKQENTQNREFDELTSKIMGLSDEHLIDRLIRDDKIQERKEFLMRSYGRELLVEIHYIYSLEMTRRLLIEIRRFNKATTWFSIALIALVIVQILIAVIQLEKL